MRTSTLISFVVIVLLSLSTILSAEEISWRAEGKTERWWLEIKKR